MHSATAVLSKPASNSSRYLLDLSIVEPGDVIFSTTDEVKSRAIRFFTNSAYSHAMLYVGGTVIHADSGGVFSVGPDRKLVGEGQMAVFRLREPLEGDRALAACNFARSKVGSVYSVPEAILVPFRWWRKKAAKRVDQQFCSRLVAQAYSHVGIEFVRNTAYCSPARLARSPLLRPVEGAVRIASDYDLAVAAKQPDIREVNQLHTFAWLTQVRILATSQDASVDTVESAFKFVEEFPEHDDLVASYIAESGYLEDYKLDEACNEFRYDLTRMLSGRIDAEFFDREFGINVDQANSALSALIAYKPKFALKIYDQQIALHEARIQQAIARTKILGQACLLRGMQIESDKAFGLALKMKSCFEGL